MKISVSSGRTFLVAAALAALLAVGCGKTPGVNDSASNTDGANGTQLASMADSGGASAAPFSNRGKDAEGRDSKSPASQVTTIPAGTAVTVRLQNSVSSATNSAGDHFDAVLASPIEVNGRTLAPAGAPVSGRVVAVERSGRLKHPGYISLALNSVQIGGKSVAVETSSISAKGGSHKKRDIALIGGGAGGGALIGGLLGGGKGALIGSAVGAGAGTTTAYATGKKDVGFGVERQLTFRLRQPVQVK